MRKSIVLTLILLLAIGLGWQIASGDPVSVTVAWTAPGDDGNIGTCTAYDLRWSQDSTDLVDNFVSQSGGLLSIIPQVAGSTESYTIPAMDPSTVYYVAIRAVDDADNWAGLSNILRFETPDNEPPAVIADLRLL